MQSFKKFNFFTVCFILIGLTASCIAKKPILPSYFYSQSDSPAHEKKQDLNIVKKESLNTTDKKPLAEESYPESFVCQKGGRGCWEFPECRNFCENLFFNEQSQHICHQWPISLFKDFENLFVTINTKPFHNIEPQVLKCFLKLSKDKNILFKKFDMEEAKEFLEEVAVNPELAFYLAGEDKDRFSILHTLFQKIHSRVPGAIKSPLSLNKGHFLILLHEHQNRSAWAWLNDYIGYHCRRDSSCKEPLDYYCEILRDVHPKIMEDFFKNRHFKQEYKKDIELKPCGSTTCPYGTVQGFEKMCEEL